MNAEERADWERRCMRFQETLEGKTPKPSPEKRLEWLEADSAAHRTAILKMEQEVKRLRIGGAVVAAVAGFLLGRAFL